MLNVPYVPIKFRIDIQYYKTILVVYIANLLYSQKYDDLYCCEDNKSVIYKIIESDVWNGRLHLFLPKDNACKSSVLQGL